jgi:hypothetical protein
LANLLVNLNTYHFSYRLNSTAEDKHLAMVLMQFLLSNLCFLL